MSGLYCAPRVQPSELAWRALTRNVRGGIELAFFRRVGKENFSASFSQVILLMTLNLALAFAWGALVTKSPRILYLDGLAVIGLWTLTVPAFAVLSTREVSRLESRSLQTTVMLLSPLFTGWVFYSGLVVLTDQLPWLEALDLQIVHVFTLWIVAVFSHVLAQTLDMPRRHSLSLCLTYGLVLFLILSHSAVPVTWYQDYRSVETRPAPEPWLDVETILYEQRDRVAATLAELAPERAGVQDVYFLGFAGYARQDVFRKEVGFVRGLFDRRFDTRGRSMVLVNHRDAIDTTPIASVSNLTDAIVGLSKIMNPEEDLLVVYLTSHGSKKHELSVRFPRFPLNQIDVKTLPALFESNGIEWPVVIISACYSGGFIPSLAGDQTMVITSAAADRTSFGCGNDSDLTYFARAFVEEQLEHTRDLELAFERARARLEAWETDEGLTPSNPQLSSGGKMARRIRALVDRLEAVGDVDDDPDSTMAISDTAGSPRPTIR